MEISANGEEYWRYDYDLFNRLVSVGTASEGGAERTVATYAYDHQGRRVYRIGDATEEADAETTITRYSFDVSGRIVEETTSGETTVYVFGFGKHLAKVEGYGTGAEATFFYLTDHLGTTTGLTDETGLLIWRDDASPFADATGASISRGGLHYSNARWYDARTGRFTTEDPIRDGWNWYQYASANPLLYVDPDGVEDAPFSRSQGEYDLLPTIPRVETGDR
ncbi:MAG: RHS repeat-associated core domain-containing protein [Spirochaetota bacterium]